MFEMASEDHAILPASSANDAFDLIAKSSRAHQQETHVTVFGHQRNCFGQREHSMPWPKRADKAGQDFALWDTQFPAGRGAANIRTKSFGIDSVRIDDYLLIGNSDPEQITAF